VHSLKTQRVHCRSRRIYLRTSSLLHGSVLPRPDLYGHGLCSLCVPGVCQHCQQCLLKSRRARLVCPYMLPKSLQAPGLTGAGFRSMSSYQHMGKGFERCTAFGIQQADIHLQHGRCALGRTHGHHGNWWKGRAKDRYALQLCQLTDFSLPWQRLCQHWRADHRRRALPRWACHDILPT